MRGMKLSPSAKIIMATARKESTKRGHFYLDVEHLFIALTKVKSGVTQAFLKNLKLNPVSVRKQVVAFIGVGDGRGDWKGIKNTPRIEAALKLAVDLSGNKPGALVDEGDLLEAVLKEGGGKLLRQLNKMGITSSNFVAWQAGTAGDISKSKQQIESIKPVKSITKIKVAPIVSKHSDTPMIDEFGEDLTRKAANGELADVIGKNDEILELARMLSRKIKNSAVLHGEAGVGKAAVVDGLALLISRGKGIPASLINARIIKLDIAGSNFAETTSGGQFEQRLAGTLDEAKNNPGIIIFINEIHAILGADQTSGNGNASNILKSWLSRGDKRCIGTTTPSGYHRYFIKNSALMQRFNAIEVCEPSEHDTIEILKQWKISFEKFHQVRIDYSAMEAAVRLSGRYIADRHFPDKAIDIIDDACTNRLVPDIDTHSVKKYRVTKIVHITGADVAAVMSRQTGIPIDHLEANERTRLLQMAEILKKRVVGQDEAVEKVVSAIQSVRIGLNNNRRPVGIFLFLGPTGTGKAELVKAIAAFLFGSDKALIRINMAEYTGENSSSRLIGTSTGPTGGDKEGYLSGQLRRKPYSVVLLDRVENAHPKVLRVLLQLFNEGKITDSTGNTVDARNAIFIMTSTIGFDLPNKTTIGFQSADVEKAPAIDTINEYLKEYFTVEFLNRIDVKIIFRALDKDDILKIYYLLISRLKKTMKSEQKIYLDVANKVAAYICQRSYDPDTGATVLGNTFKRVIEEPLIERIIKGKFKARDRVLVKLNKNKIAFTKRKKPKALGRLVEKADKISK